MLLGNVFIVTDSQISSASISLFKMHTVKKNLSLRPRLLIIRRLTELTSKRELLWLWCILDLLVILVIISQSDSSRKHVVDGLALLLQSAGCLNAFQIEFFLFL